MSFEFAKYLLKIAFEGYGGDKVTCDTCNSTGKKNISRQQLRRPYDLDTKHPLTFKNSKSMFW